MAVGIRERVLPQYNMEFPCAPDVRIPLYEIDFDRQSSFFTTPKHVQSAYGFLGQSIALSLRASKQKSWHYANGQAAHFDSTHPDSMIQEFRERYHPDIVYETRAGELGVSEVKSASEKGGVLVKFNQLDALLEMEKRGAIPSYVFIRATVENARTYEGSVEDLVTEYASSVRGATIVPASYVDAMRRKALSDDNNVSINGNQRPLGRRFTLNQKDLSDMGADLRNLTPRQKQIYEEGKGVIINKLSLDELMYSPKNLLKQLAVDDYSIHRFLSPSLMLNVEELGLSVATPRFPVTVVLQNESPWWQQPSIAFTPLGEEEIMKMAVPGELDDTFDVDAFKQPDDFRWLFE